MIELKLYLYDSTKEDNGYRGTDLSRYVLMGTQNTEDITQVVDITEITLAGYPTGVAFAPETMFVLDETENDEIFRTFHRVVKDDYVSQPILSRDDYFDHSITLTEPSIIAQKRIVDNMSITYKLKNVKLETQSAYDLNATTGFVVAVKEIKPTENCGYHGAAYLRTLYATKYFDFDGEVRFLSTTTTTSVNKKYVDLSNFVTEEGTYKAKLRLPTLHAYAGLSGTTTTGIFRVSTHWEVKEYGLNGEFIRNVLTHNCIENDDLTDIGGDYAGEWLPESGASGINIPSYLAFPYFRRYTDKTAPSPSYTTEEFQIFEDRTYKIKVALYNFPDTELPNPSSANGQIYTGSSIGGVVRFSAKSGLPRAYDCTTSVQVCPPSSYERTAVFTTYLTAQAYTVFSSGIPYTCENLIKKAFLNTTLYSRKPNLPTASIDNTEYNCPFYIDPAFVPKLQSTQVNETFFNQKNLWEVLIEAGHYIHAIPELVFGQNGKFMLTFNELGSTERKTNEITRSSIMNFQGVDDYVCELNSYITNYVQLGGQITEWVAAKSSDNSFLVYNDNAQIITSFPIIELVEIKIRADNNDDSGILAGQEEDATSYFYEKNVYAILSNIATDIPNKGIAMYYSLGDNKIMGGDYRLPRINDDAWSDYTIKKLIYSAFKGYVTSGSGTLWTKLKVNNFSFRVTYRTKSDVRQAHTRPDVRKFLVNSKFDKTPQHKQMNNQTDVVVDSNKYGSNMYGTLLKTGNNNYEMEGWYDSVLKLPHKGDLHRINGENYYVAKIKNTYYSNHIESVITYSKDYNELSKIIGIPSEPRFYEISEQSLINRYVSIDDYLIVTTNSDNLSPNNADGYLKDTTHLRKLILGTMKDFAKYAMVAFKGDTDIGSLYSTFGDPSLYKEVLSPLNAYSSGNTLTYSWTMTDNFSAGDKVGEIEYSGAGSTADKAYRAMTAVKYTDEYGKATLFDFFIIEDYSFNSANEINNMPESPVTAKGDKTIKNVNILATNVDIDDDNYNRRGLILLKDCRERITFNYNLRFITDSDTFVSSPYFFTPKSASAKLAILEYDEINKLSSGYVSTAAISAVINIPDSAIVNIQGTNAYNQSKPVGFTLKISSLIGDTYFTAEGTPKFKAIALITEYNSQSTLTQFTLARNIDGSFSKEVARADWVFGVPKDTFFGKRQ
jgi:hypothetical protein